MRSRLLSLALPFAVVLSVTGSMRTMAQGGGGGTAEGPQFKVLRSMAGPSGTEKDGHLVIDDPRTVFYLGEDKKVVVYFEWEGPPGPHKFEGTWKNTENKVTLISEFQYVASARQFSGYWSMLLSGAETPGMWKLEARIDGESAGELSFQLIAGPNTAPPPAPAPAPRPPLSPGDLYKRMAEVMVWVDKIDAQGRAVARGSGFYLDNGELVTAFQNIDGAAKLRVIEPDGSTQGVAAVQSYNRWQDWAILASSRSDQRGLTRAAAKSWAVGSIGYFLQASTASARVIADGTIVGQNTYPKAGARLNLAESPNRGSIGSPLVNEFAEVVGMVGGALAPGTDLLGSYMLSEPPNNLNTTSFVQYGLAIPITLIPDSANQTAPVSFDELAQRRQFLPLLSSENRIIWAGLALNLEKSQGLPNPANSRQQFSRQDQKMWVYVNWNENDPFKGTVTMSLYDADNRTLGESQAKKIALRSGSLTMTTWEVPLAPLPPGIYRVDVSLGQDIVWRRFFRVVE